MAEKLVEKCGITFEEAAAVLKQTDYDMLEAMILLERQGKLNSNSNRYSTGGFVFEEKQLKKTAADAESFGEFVRMILLRASEILRDIMSYNLVIRRPEGGIASLPVILAVIICCIGAFPVLALVIVSLVMGFSYSIEKKERR